MAKAAKQVGLEVVEEKRDAELVDIERNLNAGAYIIVNYLDAFTGNGHFSVITEHDETGFYFVDSYFGFFHLDKADFKKWWYNSDKTLYGWYVAVE